MLEILLLLGALATAGGLWAAFGGRDDDGSRAAPFSILDEDRGGKGPRSSPDLPEAGKGADGDRGRAVRIGADGELRAVLQGGQVQARLATGGDAAALKEPPKKKRKPLKVTYSTDQIIARASRYSHHRRTLQNADNLVEKQKAEQAREIYQRTHKRIPDEEIQSKIEQNIEDIDRWLAGLDVEEEDDEALRFPEIVIPLTSQAIAIENLTQGLKSISEGLVESISEAMNRAEMLRGLPAGDRPSIGPPADSPASDRSAPAARAPAAAPAAAPSEGTTITGPVTATGPITMGGPGAGGPGTGDPGAGGAGSGGGGAGGGGGGGRGGIGAAAEPSINISVHTGEALEKRPARPGLGETVSVGRDEDKEDESLPPGIQVNEYGELVTDGWTDADFAREWEKFRNLPLKDRRSGKDRRVMPDRRRDRRKDRRSGLERRKKDLFKERDEFLRKLERHKKNKQLLEDWRKTKKKKKEEASINISIGEPKDPAAAAAPPEPVMPPEALPEALPAALPEPDPEPEPKDKKKDEPEEKGKEEEGKEEEGPPQVFKMDAPELNPLAFPRAEERHLAPEAEGMAGVPAMAEPVAEEAPPDQMAATGEGVEDSPGIPALGGEDFDDGDEGEVSDEPKPPPQEIHGVLELKPPEEDDAPFLTLTYDFSKIPDSFQLSRDYHTMEYAYYKYKPMLVKAQEFTRRKMLKNALNYYRVIKSQNIPPEFKRMINRNIQDITEYLEKFLMSRGEY